jgi:cyanophycin synthetase
VLQLSKSKVYEGPSPYSMEPVVVARLQVGHVGPAEYRKITVRIAELSDDWFVEDALPDDLPSDEALAKFLLHWSLSALNWVKGAIEASGHGRAEPAGFLIWVGFHVAPISDLALRAAVKIANAAAADRLDRKDFDAVISEIWMGCRRYHPDSSDELIVRGAKASDVPFFAAWNLVHHWQFGWGARSEVFCSAASNQVGLVFGRVANDKVISKRLIESLGFPAPRHVSLNAIEDVDAAIADIGFPGVVKPISLRGGQGIRAGLQSRDEVVAAYHSARQETRDLIILEEFVEGDDHRLLVIDGRFIGAFRREPPVITGDGKHTIAQLIAKANKGRALAGNFNAHRATKIAIDDNVLEYLARQSLSPDSLPATGRDIVLRSNANASTGGSCREVTGVHPDIVAMAEALTRASQTRMIGLDYITTDITRSWREVPGALIELNSMPALGIPTQAGRSLIEIGRLALGTRPGRIPVHVIVLPDDRMADAEERSSKLVDGASGWASHDSAAIGNLRLQPGQDHPWAGVRTLLSHGIVERALILVPIEHLYAHGLPVDRADKIWMFATSMIPEWQEVLRRASRSPLREGDWADIAGHFGRVEEA